MRKNIDIDDAVLLKLKVLSVFENTSVKGLMEEAVSAYVKQKEIERLEQMTSEEKEDLGLLSLMQKVDLSDTVPEKQVFDLLDE
jgi:ATP phosphoribosyltransferase regulatory subunit HisZ